MKGVIFKLFEDFVTTRHGADTFDDLLDATPLETEGPIVGPGTYPAEDLLALVGSASAMLDTPVDDLLHAFGRHAFPALAYSVPGLMVGLDDARSFLLGLEAVIHTEVRKLDHDADPARFTVTDVDDDELLMHYRSPFGLFPLVEGFLDGIADWYRQPIAYERIDTDGTNATYRIRTGPGLGAEVPPATGSLAV